MIRYSVLPVVISCGLLCGLPSVLRAQLQSVDEATAIVAGDRPPDFRPGRKQDVTALCGAAESTANRPVAGTLRGMVHPAEDRNQRGGMGQVGLAAISTKATRFRSSLSSAPTDNNCTARAAVCRGPELPLMIEQVLSQAGNHLQRPAIADPQDFAGQGQGNCLPRATPRAPCGSSARSARLGTLGSLGSYAQVAVQADGFAKKLVEQGRAALTAANDKLGQEATRLEGALALAETKRIYSALPPLKNEIVAAANAARTNPDLRDTLQIGRAIGRGSRPAAEAGRPAPRRDGAQPHHRRQPRHARGQVGRRVVAGAGSGRNPRTPPQPRPTPPRRFASWTSDRGTTLEAALVDFGYGDPAAKKDPYVVLEKRDGQRITVPFARLSAESQQLSQGRGRETTPGVRRKAQSVRRVRVGALLDLGLRCEQELRKRADRKMG